MAFGAMFGLRVFRWLLVLHDARLGRAESAMVLYGTATRLSSGDLAARHSARAYFTVEP